MQRLFCYEIAAAIDSLPTEIRLSQLPFYRREAVTRAYIQQKGSELLGRYYILSPTGENQLKCETTDQDFVPAARNLYVISAPSSGCEPPERHGALPFYLWDRKASKTVEVADLPGEISYTVISHT